jgi:hypothetical protein
VPKLSLHPDVAFSSPTISSSSLSPYPCPPHPRTHTPLSILQNPSILPTSLTPGASLHPALDAPDLQYDVRCHDPPAQSNPHLSPAILATPASNPPLPSLEVRFIPSSLASSSSLAPLPGPSSPPPSPDVALSSPTDSCSSLPYDSSLSPIPQTHALPFIPPKPQPPGTYLNPVLVVPDLEYDVRCHGPPTQSNPHLSPAILATPTSNPPLPSLEVSLASSSSLAPSPGPSSPPPLLNLALSSPTDSSSSFPPYPPLSLIPQTHALPFIPPKPQAPGAYLHPALVAPALQYDVRYPPTQSNPHLSPAILATPASNPPLPSLSLRVGDLPWIFNVVPDTRLLPGEAYVTVHDVLLSIHYHLRTAVKGAEYEAMSKLRKSEIFREFDRRVGTDPVQRGKGLQRVDFLNGQVRAQGLVQAMSKDSIWDVVVSRPRPSLDTFTLIISVG